MSACRHGLLSSSTIGWGGPDDDDNVARGIESHEESRKFALINCWHMNEFESAAMWKLYFKGDEGVAIESTFAKLKDSFSAARKHEIYIGEVQYLDFERQSAPFRNVFYTFLAKRRSFEHEKELRAFVWDSKYKRVRDGKYIPVDTQTLINRVFVSPAAGVWFHEVVESVAEKYGIDKSKLVQSDLYKPPYPGIKHPRKAPKRVKPPPWRVL